MALIIEPSPNMSVSRNPVDYDYRLTIMSYDARGRVEAIMKWNDNTGFDMVHYIYNSMNQVVTVTAADALYKFMIWNEYDDNGRLHRVYTKKGELNSGLFENGNIHFDDLRFPYPFWTGDPDGGFPVNEPAVEYEYNERGSVSKIKYFGFGADEDVVIQKEIIYNPRGWVDQLTIREMVTSPVVLFSQAFERNSIGNITKQTSNRNGYDELVQDYTYDRLNRLIEWDESKYGTNEKYSYDKIGNRTSHEINNMTMRDYVYNPDTNRLNYFYFEDENFDQHSTSYTYNNIGQMLTRLKSFNSDTISHEGYKYNTAGRLVEYTKSNISGFGSSFNQSLLPHESFTADKWTYGYKYNHAGVREQKRMLTSPHGDGDIDDEGIKVFAHLWEYYMTGAFGEEIVQYKGFQTSADVGMGPERKVYLGAYRYRAGGELLYHHDGTKEVNFTDNNGSVRLVVRQNGTAFDTLHFDYKPFGDTLWTSAGTMNRDNFDGSTYDSESDLQMLGFRMYDNETGRFTTPDLLWSAFPAQTPYHYAYNSPMTYRDPTGLAPEKEKEREELQVFLIPDLDLHDGLINELKNNPAYNHYYIIAMADLTFANVMKLNDFYLSYGGGSGGRTAEGKGAENGQGGKIKQSNVFDQNGNLIGTVENGDGIDYITDKGLMEFTNGDGEIDLESVKAGTKDGRSLALPTGVQIGEFRDWLKTIKQNSEGGIIFTKDGKTLAVPDRFIKGRDGGIEGSVDLIGTINSDEFKAIVGSIENILLIVHSHLSSGLPSYVPGLTGSDDLRTARQFNNLYGRTGWGVFQFNRGSDSFMNGSMYFFDGYLHNRNTYRFQMKMKDFTNPSRGQ
ncbi:MAG: hypothetical protein KF896_03320 [Ignavibacteriae bacterium]|nr:hypothetical protein [Ignavibacteriota bacterium]